LREVIINKTIGGTALKKLFFTSMSSPCKDSKHKSFGEISWCDLCCTTTVLLFRNLSAEDALRDSPVVVCGANIGDIPELSETGFCIYDLERIQDGSDVISALKVDFYRADPLASMKDEEVIHVTLKAVAAALKISKFGG